MQYLYTHADLSIDAHKFYEQNSNCSLRHTCCTQYNNSQVIRIIKMQYILTSKVSSLSYFSINTLITLLLDNLRTLRRTS